MFQLVIMMNKINHQNLQNWNLLNKGIILEKKQRDLLKVIIPLAEKKAFNDKN